MAADREDSKACAAADWLHATLDQLPDRMWDELELAARNRRHAYHTPVFGTVRDGAPAVRTVVLRKADRSELVLQCHTDVRCGKVSDLAEEARVEWLFYDPDSKVQLRIGAIATLHRDDPFADAAWAATAVTSRRCYLAEAAPGATVDYAWSGLPDDLEGPNPDQERSEAGRQNFAVVRTRVTAIDWLFLNAKGNRRARFEYDDQGCCSPTWLVP